METDETISETAETTKQNNWRDQTSETHFVVCI